MSSQYDELFTIFDDELQDYVMAVNGKAFSKAETFGVFQYLQKNRDDVVRKFFKAVLDESTNINHEH